jgi:hypothetical protein
MVWCISSYKPSGQPAYVSASEGTLTEYSQGKAFSCELFSCRKFRREVAGGRATKAAITDAVRLMLSEMAAAGVIKKTALVEHRSSLQAA